MSTTQHGLGTGRIAITSPRAGTVTGRSVLVEFSAPTQPAADYKVRLTVGGNSTDYPPDADGASNSQTQQFDFTVSNVPVPQPAGTTFTLSLYIVAQNADVGVINMTSG